MRALRMRAELASYVPRRSAWNHGLARGARWHTTTRRSGRISAILLEELVEPLDAASREERPRHHGGDAHRPRIDDVVVRQRDGSASVRVAAVMSGPLFTGGGI